MKRTREWIVMASLCLAACGDDAQTPVDAPVTADAPVTPDASTPDASTPDAALPDAAPPDAAPPDAEPPPVRVITGNNSATLPGDPFPVPGADNSVLRKEVPYTVIDPHPDIVFGTGYITRGQIPENLVQFILRVTNNGAVPHCFISANSITYRRDNGTVIDDTGLAYVIGSVQQLSTVQTAACLRPGETGYFLELDGNLIYDEIASVEFQLRISQSGTSTDPLAECIPLSYSYEAATEVLTVPYENTGTASCTVDGGFPRWLLLDDQGEPLWWLFLLDNTQPPDGIVAPGAMGQVGNNANLYMGVGSTVHAWIDFEDVTTPLRREPVPALTRGTPEERLVETLRLYNLRERDKETRLLR